MLSVSLEFINWWRISADFSSAFCGLFVALISLCSGSDLLPSFYIGTRIKFYFQGWIRDSSVSLLGIMATLSHVESRRLYSWWWDSHISPKNSKWLKENLAGITFFLHIDFFRGIEFCVHTNTPSFIKMSSKCYISVEFVSCFASSIRLFYELFSTDCSS